MSENVLNVWESVDCVRMRWVCENVLNVQECVNVWMRQYVRICQCMRMCWMCENVLNVWECVECVRMCQCVKVCQCAISVTFLFNKLKIKTIATIRLLKCIFLELFTNKKGRFALRASSAKITSPKKCWKIKTRITLWWKRYTRY